jgi:transcriptional regulator with XRE-family HTH domain
MRDIMVGVMARHEWSEAAGALIADARSRAGMTQAELAARAGTVQSAIAAYEAGHRQPTLPTLYRIVAAAGFDLRARLAPADDHDDTLAAWEASLPEAERERWRSKLAGQRQQAKAWAAT